MQSVRQANERAVFAVLCLGVFAYGILQSLVFPVVPTLQRALDTSESQVTWVLTANLVSAAIATPLLGRYGDLVGKKRTFVVALAGLALGSLVAAPASSLSVVIVGRAIQGIGGATVPLAFGLIRDEFPPEKVAGAIGVMSALVAVGSGTGIVLGGLIIHALNYHWLFWIPLIVTTVATIAAVAVIPESPVRSGGRLNLFAGVLLSGWLVLLLLAVSEAPDWGWGSASVIGLACAAVGLFVMWVRAEARSANPLIDMRMMRLRAVWTTNLSTFLFGAGYISALVYVPEFVQEPTSTGYGFGASVSESGVMALPLTVTAFLFGMLTGRLATRLGSKNVAIAGTAISAATFVLIAFVHGQKFDIYLEMAAMGVGFGLAASALANLIVAAVPLEQTGVASGMNANIRTIGGAIGSAIASSVIVLGASGGVPKESGFVNAFAMLSAIGFLAVVVAFFVPRVRRDPATHREPGVELRHPELATVVGGTLVGDGLE